MHLSTAMKRVITLPGMTVAFALLGATPAVADGPPKMPMVSAHFIATEVTGNRREVTCTGQDGTYHELRQTWLGTSIQDIPTPVPPMTGNFDGTLVIRSKLLWKLPTTPNAATGQTISGTAYVIDSSTHMVKVAGKFLGAANFDVASFSLTGVSAGGIYEGFVNGPNTAYNGKLVGNIDISLDTIDSSGDPTGFHGTLGGTGSAEHPAVVVQGSCEHDTDDIMEEVN